MSLPAGRNRYLVLAIFLFSLCFFTIIGWKHDAAKAAINYAKDTWRPSSKSNLDLPSSENEIKLPPALQATPTDPNIDAFPLAAQGQIPAINHLNAAPADAPSTPLFIGFTRNWFILQQAVVSYITSGWPAAQIYVVDNTGVMDSNELGLLTPSNPYYLNHTRLAQLGVKVVRTPTILTFAQLQNYFINYAVEQKWPYFFWSHMDVIALSEEALDPYKPFYSRVLECLESTKEDPKWALRFFAYDWLTLVNVQPMKDVGGWDTQIPYYMTDCDMYERLHQRNLTDTSCRAGFIYDVASYLEDVGDLYPSPKDDATLNSDRFTVLIKKLDRMQREKHENKKGRNTWQDSQTGGQDEPFYRHPQGFQKGIDFWIEKGREMFALKWGYPHCDIIAQGRKAGDEWRYKDLETLMDYNEEKSE